MDPVLLQMKDFDVMLGIDWVSSYQVVIYYRKKKVHSRLKHKVKLAFQGRGRDKSVGIIPLQHARKLL